MKKLTQEQKQLLYSIADRYRTSIPVSGNWRTETEHELNAICKELGVRKDTAKNIMKKYLGFTDREFIKAGLNSDKNSADKIYKVVSEIADRHGSAGEALNYVNDNAPSNLKKYINDRSKYIDDEEVELEDEDDEGNTFYYNDTVNTRIEYFYSPWNGRNFEVINLNEEM